MRFSRSGYQSIVLWLDTAGYDRGVRTETKANVARIERLMYDVRELRYKRRRRKTLAYVPDELPWQKALKKEI